MNGNEKNYEEAVMTEYRRSLMERDEEIMAMWRRMMSNPMSMKKAVMQRISDEMHVTVATVYNVIRKYKRKEQQ